MRTVLLSACLVAGVLPAIAARPRQATPPIAITLDVAVTDRNGRAIPGLAANDFSVQLDGRAQRVVAATYLAAGAPMAGAIGPAFDAVTPAIPIYRLTVEAPADTPAGREFGVTVTVARTGVKVGADSRARATPIETTREARPSAPAGGTLSTPDRRLRQAIATGRTERGLAIALGVARRRAANAGDVTLDVQVEIAGTARAPLTALLGVVDANGGIRTAGQELSQPEDGAFRVEFSLPLPPGSQKLRFAVAAADGTIGAIEAPITADLTSMGPLQASDLVRWTSGRDGRPRRLASETIPAGAATLGASLEVYATAASTMPPDVLVKMSLEQAGGGQPPAIERIVTPETRDGALTAEAEFPLDRIASGSYVLRAVVLSGATVLGTTSATLIKR